LISLHPSTKGLVKVFRRVVSKGRGTGLGVTFYKVVQKQEKIWSSKRSMFSDKPQKERTCCSLLFLDCIYLN